MSTYPNTIAVAGGTFGTFNYVFVSEVGTQFRYRKSSAPATDIYFDTSDNKWYDGSPNGQPTAFWNKTVNPNGISGGNNPSVACTLGDQIQLLQAPGAGNLGSFTHPDISSSSGTGGTVHRTGTFVPPATIYCTDTTHAQYPSHASGYLFARDTSNDVTVGGVITKYAYILGETTVPQGYPNHVIHLDTATNTWVDGHATNEPHPIEHVPGVHWIRWRHASQSSTTWYYFEDKSSWYSGTGGGGFLSMEDPRFENVSFTKTEDDHVTLTFDFDEMDGNLSSYVVHKKAADGTETNSADQGISGSSGTITRTGAHIPILDGLADGDQLWIEHSSNPIHIVYGNDGYGGIDNPYVHKIVDWSIEYVNGQKSVVARFFGVDTGLYPDHAITADGPRINTQDPVVWDGTLKTATARYKPNTLYSINRNTGNTAPVYGARFKTKGGKVFSNFW